MKLKLSQLALVVAAMCAMFVSSTAFTGSPLTAGRVAQARVISAAPPAVPRADVAGEGSSVSAFGCAAIAGAAVAAAASRRRQQRASVARRVSVAEIESMTVEDIPFRWRDKVSLGQAKRNNLVRDISTQLEKSFFIMAFNKDGMTTPEVEEARSMFPEECIVRCLKNKLVAKAMQGTEWEEFSTCLKGGNMYVFVEEDTYLKGALEAFLKIDKKFKRQECLDKLKESMAEVTFDLRPFVGGCLRDEWALITAADLPTLKEMPTKLQMIAQIAGGVKQVTQKLAVGLNQLPKKTAVGIKKIVEKMEEEGKDSVKDVVA